MSQDTQGSEPLPPSRAIAISSRAALQTAVDTRLRVAENRRNISRRRTLEIAEQHQFSEDDVDALIHCQSQFRAVPARIERFLDKGRTMAEVLAIYKIKDEFAGDSVLKGLTLGQIDRFCDAFASSDPSDPLPSEEIEEAVRKTIDGVKGIRYASSAIHYLCDLREEFPHVCDVRSLLDMAEREGDWDAYAAEDFDPRDEEIE